MVENAHHDTETTLAEFLNHFIAVSDVVVISDIVLLLVSVEAVICCFIHFTPVRAAWLLGFLSFYFLSLRLVEKVYYGVLEHLSLLIFIHVVTKYLNGFLAGHREFMLSVSHHRISVRQFRAQTCRPGLFYANLAAGTYRPRRLQGLASIVKVCLRELDFCLH